MTPARSSNRKASPCRGALAFAIFVASIAPAAASAQPADLANGVTAFGFTFRPSVEVRVRGEYKRHPIDTGGAVFASNAVLATGASSETPPTIDTRDAVDDQVLVAERSRIGLAVDRGPATAAFVLQDARVFGSTEAAFAGPGEAALPSLAPFEAYLDLHTKSGRRVFFRVGRQRVQWGDGRLVGSDDWSATARSLDAARAGVQVWDLDIEAMAAMLAAPGGLPPEVAGAREPAASATGSQLYGLDVVWHLWPLLQIEATGLARVVRQPVPTNLTPSDTFVLDGRLFGDRRGFRYAVEGAYELGRVGVAAGERDLAAFALAARASLETTLFWHLTPSIEAAYASGDDGDPSGKLKRFDPILPNQHDTLGPMSLYAWSNIIQLGGSVGMTPFDSLAIQLGYRWVALAEPNGRWTTAALVPVGASPTNTSTSLGNELDAALKITPWQPIEIQTGYGIFVNGMGARWILLEVGRPAKIEHWAYLQAQLRAP